MKPFATVADSGLIYTCRKDLSELMGFTFTYSRFTTIQAPGSPKHRTNLFDNPRIRLSAARIHQIFNQFWNNLNSSKMITKV